MASGDGSDRGSGDDGSDGTHPVRLEGSRFRRYLLVGGLATAVHFVLLALMVESRALPAWLGSGAGAVVGAQVAFAGNRHYTFGHRGALWPAWWRFMGTAAIGAALGMTIVAASVRLGLHYLVAQASATAASVLLTYAMNRAWSFSSRYGC